MNINSSTGVKQMFSLKVQVYIYIMRRMNALKTSGKTKKINKYKLNCISHDENINVVLYVLYQQHTIINILFFVKSKLNLHTDILKRSLGDEGRGG